jgi:hypothetical protein
MAKAYSGGALSIGLTWLIMLRFSRPALIGPVNVADAAINAMQQARPMA